MTQISYGPEALAPLPSERPVFADPGHPDCGGCNSHVMKADPLVANERFVLAQTGNVSPDGALTYPTAWIVFAQPHVEASERLGADWMASIKAAVCYLRQSGISAQLTYNENSGANAGQTLPHKHGWLTARSPETEAPQTSGLGLHDVVRRAADRAADGRALLPSAWPVILPEWADTLDDMPDDAYKYVKREIARLRQMGITHDFNVSFDIPLENGVDKAPAAIWITARNPEAEPSEVRGIGLTTIARRAIQAARAA